MCNDTANQSLITELNAATEGLLFQSESDYPISAFCLPSGNRKTLSRDEVAALVNSKSQGAVTEISFDDFFSSATAEQSWQGPAEKANVNRFKNLVHVLKTTLSDIRVFRIGDTEAEIYVIGRTSCGDFGGISTKVIET